MPLRESRNRSGGGTDAGFAPGQQDRTMRALLVATDGSMAAGTALDEAIALAAEIGDEVAVITVWRALQGDFGLAYPSAAMLDDILDAERKHAEATLADATARAAAAGVPIRTRLATGDPAEQICAYAGEIDARLLAVGTRGYGSVASLLLGSVSNAIIRHAPCPVLVVRETAARARPPHGAEDAPAE
jgi:nucleotide-binding universal stress UspA family protein